MTNRLTHEENILYLMIELDQALARKAPRWAPEQMDVARRWLASLLEKLLRSSRGRDGAAVTATLRRRALRPFDSGNMHAYRYRLCTMVINRHSRPFA